MARRTKTPVGPAELEELHARITAGDQLPPWPHTRTGRAYKRWCDEHPERAEQARTARQAPQLRYGKPRFTNRYASLDGRGFKGAFSGRMAVVSAPAATQTSTNYGLSLIHI